MPRSALRVRPAEASDLPAMVRLASELREALLPASGPDATAGLRPGSPPGRAVLEARLAEALGSPERHLVLVVGERDEVLGMALLTVAPANALLDSPVVHMTHAVVEDRHRRRGAGRALVAAAAGFAEERRLDQLVVSVRPGSRDANRFFARLGFAPLAVRRAASVSTVRRRLALDDAVALPRRRVRRSLVLAQAPGRAPVPAQAPAAAEASEDPPAP